MQGVPGHEPLESFGTRGLPRAIELDDEGIHYPRPHGGGFGFTAYAEIGHLATSSRAVWISARRSVYTIPRRSFSDPHGPEHLVRALLARISRRPGGAAQLARMAQIEELAATPPKLRTTWTLGLLCLLTYALQLVVGMEVSWAAYYSPALVRTGELWRFLTANLVHAFPLHAAFNLLGLYVLGLLVERPLGSARTACVATVAGLGAMGASDLAGYARVVGLSGVVLGLAGSLAVVELRFGSRLPAWWRLPRRLLMVLIVIEAGVQVFALLWFPIVAVAAHFGGFVAGALATLPMRLRSHPREQPPLGVRAGAAAAVLLLVVSLAGVGRELLRGGDSWARHLALIAEYPRAAPGELNDLAWAVAIAPESTPAQLEAALGMAERAVSETDRGLAPLLDTLAELHFLLGRPQPAIAAIEEAIELEPDETYYREQRRRFTGERDPDDRPEEPALRPQEPETPPEPEPGLRARS